MAAVRPVLLSITYPSVLIIAIYQNGWILHPKLLDSGFRRAFVFFAYVSFMQFNWHTGFS